MATAIRVRHYLRQLHLFINPAQYEDLAFALSNFELYLSGDEYADGDEFRNLIEQFEDILNNLREDIISGPVEGVTEDLYIAMEEYLGELGYDWDYEVEAWLRKRH